MDSNIRETSLKRKNVFSKRLFISKKIFRLNWQLYAMVIPGVLLIFMFSYLPMFGIVLAFKNYNFIDGILGSPWVGLDNFKFFFTSDDAARVTRNTIFLNSLMIVSNLVISVGIALILNYLKGSLFKKITQSFMIFPNFISWVIAGFFAYSIFDPNYGILNSIIKVFGVEAINWYDKPELWPLILVLSSIWKAAGYGGLIYIAAIAGISEELYEAAALDGANSFDQAIHIVLPHITPLISMITLLSIGKIFNADFGLFYNLTRDVSTLYPTTDVIDTYVYRALRSGGDIGMTSAIGLYQSIVGFVLVLASNLFVKIRNPENSLF